MLNCAAGLVSLRAVLVLRFPPRDGTGCLSHFLGILFFIPWGAQLLVGTAVNLSLLAFIRPRSVVDLYSALVKKAACSVGESGADALGFLFSCFVLFFIPINLATLKLTESILNAK